MPDRDKDLVQLFVRDLDRIELPPRERWRPAERKESIVMRTSRTILYAGAVAAVLALALIAGFAMRDRGQVAAPPTSSPTPTSATASPAPTASPRPTLSPSPSPTAAPAGAITGRFGYPSDFIPPVTVYAISTTDQRVWYSVDFPGYGNPPRPTAQPGTTPGTYTISGVAPGAYWVVAYRNDATGPMTGPDPGYYSAAAACMRIPNSGGCPDQRLIPVTVVAGQTASGIDIVSWGAPLSGPPSPTFPPRPTPRP